ncbi:MAG: hypothetical protein QM778_31820 [Myxococcales bacterium]
MLRNLLLAGLVLTSLLIGSPLAAQTVIGPPMSPPPANPPPPSDELTLRAVRSDRHPPVHFSVAPGSDKLELRLYQERGVNAVLGPTGNRDTSELVPLCSLPCEISLRPRAYVFGVSTGDRGAVKVDPVLQVHDGDQVVIDYRSRLPLRILGWVLLVGGAVGGGLLLAAGLPSEQPAIPARVAAGSVLLGVGIGFGLWFVNVPDRARATITH